MVEISVSTIKDSHLVKNVKGNLYVSTIKEYKIVSSVVQIVFVFIKD